MFNTIKQFKDDWAGTAWGKAAKDFGFYLLAAVGYIVVDASSVYLTNNQTSLSALFGPYGAIVIAGLGKSLSYLRDRLKDPRVPNTPVR